MQIERQLHCDLEQTLLRVPLAQEREGRTLFLLGIPHKGWKRDENILVDLNCIINHCADVFIGQEESFESWGLRYLIDNVLRMVSGLSLETQLQDIRIKCKEFWKKERIQQLQTVFINKQIAFQSTPQSEDTTSTNLHGVDEKFFIANDLRTSVQADIISLPQIQFYTTCSDFIGEIQRCITIAFQPFNEQPIGYAEPPECRLAITYLAQCNQSLQQFSNFIAASEDLPDAIAKDYCRFVEYIQFLTEQIQHLIERIDKGCTTDKEIKRKFLIIEQELTHFSPLIIDTTVTKVL